MTNQLDGAETVRPAGSTTSGTPSSALARGSALEESLLVANQLLAVLREETGALKAFDSDLLLRLITQKEALARELGGKLKQLVTDSDMRQPAPEQPGRADTIEISPQNPMAPEIIHQRLRLREILREVERSNEINRIFINGSLTYGQDLLELFVTGTYAVGQEGQAERLKLNTKGLALDKEV